jgi:hypothetical protein
MMPRRKDIEEVTMDTRSISIEMRNGAARGKSDRWPLASVIGGIDKLTIDRRGNTTIIKIVSPQGGPIMDNWERPKRQWRSRRDGPSKTASL